MWAKQTISPYEGAVDLVELFRAKGDSIFPRSTGLWRIITAPIRFLGETFSYSRYSPAPFEKLMEEYFGDNYLRNSVKPVLVTAIDKSSRVTYAHEFFFSSHEEAKTDGEEDYYLKDIARATSAATTFFPAARIESRNHTPREFVDAGITVNNPAMLAYEKAKKIYDKPNERIVVFSFGTGLPRGARTIPADAGAARSAEPLIDNMMYMNSERTHYDFSKDGSLRPGDAYVRVQCNLDREIKLDETTDSNLAALETAAETEREEVDLIAGFLRRIMVPGAAAGSATSE